MPQKYRTSKVQLPSWKQSERTGMPIADERLDQWYVHGTQSNIRKISLTQKSESFNVNPWRPSKQVTHSRNMERLEAIVKATGLLECVFRRSNVKGKRSIPNPVLLTIQLILTHLTLTASPASKIAKSWGFSDSQTLVYTQNSVRPMFKGPNCQEIDIEWTLHVANFFKNHLLNQHELTHLRYDDLTATERPQCWKKPVSPAVLKLGKHWKGSYAYVDHDELSHIRDGQNEDYPIPDHMSGDDTDQSFQVGFSIGLPSINRTDNNKEPLPRFSRGPRILACPL